MSLLLRKVVVAFAVGFASVLVVGAPALIDAFEKQDWSNVKLAGWALVIGAIAGGLRALVALLFAFLPTDAENGVNLLGKYKSPS